MLGHLGNAIGCPMPGMGSPGFFDIGVLLFVELRSTGELFHVALQQARELFCLRALAFTTRLSVPIRGFVS